MVLILNMVLHNLFRYDREVGDLGVASGAGTNGQRSSSRTGGYANGVQSNARSTFRLRNRPGAAARAQRSHQ